MKIAIKGHESRGKEVIRILESLGGNNLYKMTGSILNCAYYINRRHIISGDPLDCVTQVYTLEEFEEQFPFKVGDVVQTKLCGEPAEVIGLYPNPACVIAYKVRYKSRAEMLHCPENIKLYKEMKEERNITLTLDKAKEWYNKGGELKEVALQAFSENELTKVDLPKSFEEFCEKYKIKKEESYINSEGKIKSFNTTSERIWNHICPSKKSAEAHLAMIQLEQLRDCYRGLFVTVTGMPVWCIVRFNGRLIISPRTWGMNETFLSFQSHEIAEEYLKNFKPLIEQAGDLI